jgi:hypothetical protein
MKTHKTHCPDDAADADKPASLSIEDELAGIRARARLLEVALLGGGGGMSLEDGTYHDALIQGAQDVAEGLDRLAKRLGA